MIFSLFFYSLSVLLIAWFLSPHYHSFPFCLLYCMVFISSLPFILFLSSLLHGSHFLSTTHSLTVILNAWFSFPLYHSFSFCPPYCMVLISSLPLILLLSSLMHGSHFLSTIHSLSVLLFAWFSLFSLYPLRPVKRFPPIRKP